MDSLKFVFIVIIILRQKNASIFENLTATYDVCKENCALNKKALQKK